MTVPRFKRRSNGMEYVSNAYYIQEETLILSSKLSSKWVSIYQRPIEKYACMQADLVNMANSVNPVRYEDFLLRRMLLMLARLSLNILDKKMTDMVEVLYANPTKCFNRKNGKNYTRSEAKEMLDKRLEILGKVYDEQFKLIKGVLESDNKKFRKISDDNVLNDRELIDFMVSKVIKALCLYDF